MASITALDLSEDTDSFQNQPPSAGSPAKRRRRGMTCVLTEVNPTAEPNLTSEMFRRWIKPSITVMLVVKRLGSGFIP